MKQKMNLAHASRTALLSSLIFFTCFASVRAQTLIPTVCTEPFSMSGTTTLRGDVTGHCADLPVSSTVPLFSTLVIDPGGPNEETVLAAAFVLGDPLVVRTSQTGLGGCLTKPHSAGETVRYTFDGVKAYFGYTNTSGATITIPRGVSTGNFFFPGPGTYSNQPSSFLPGIHQRVFSINVPPPPYNFTWNLGNRSVIPARDGSQSCASITYQGRLSNAGAAATGNYDLQFTAYDALTGGTPQSDAVIVENVPVTNGIFTVQINFGSALMGNNKTRFLEIGVRPEAATASDPFTLLAPRQPITYVPYAINALNAVNATQLNGVAANQYLKIINTSANSNQNTTTTQNASINISGTITSGCRDGFTAFAGGRLCVSGMQAAATFYGSSGAVVTCRGMQARVGNSADVMLTLTNGSFNYFSGQAQGWVADHFGDNTWGTWFTAIISPDFDGPPLDVNTGDTDGTAPSLPYRCVY
jgi:hypothetical protein